MISFDKTADPQAFLRAKLADLKPDQHYVGGVLYPFQQYYLPGQPEIDLFAIVELRKVGSGMALSAAVGQWSPSLHEALNELEERAIPEWCARHGLAWFEAGQPLKLKPVHIPKPWGQEIWYTGIEERGQSLVTDGVHSCPLPWFLALAPDYWVDGLERELNLLKILDPLPEPVFGDLYFELHEKKQEVYVVTHVDRQAWPDGQGGIRFGFNESLRKQFDSDEAFRQAYLDAVKSYEKLRREIDVQLDDLRREQGVGLNEPVSADIQRQWLKQLTQELSEREAECRAAMEQFSHVMTLTLGAVVKVPCFTPHSLLHGVRTVEFQTPVYERKILSFAQKVLTQGHWDTEEGVALASLEAPVLPPLPILSDEGGCRVEEVVDFDDFNVLRVTLAAGASYTLSGKSYLLVMSLHDELLCCDNSLSAEQAVLVPSATTLLMSNPLGDTERVALVCCPKN